MAEEQSNDPVLRHAGQQGVDRLGARAIEQTQKWEKRVMTKRDTGDGQDKKGPAGGFDATPIPHAPPGYTLKITIHKAENLPFADFGTLSSDPYILACLKTSLNKRHKQDPDLTLRTPTIHKDTNPTWNAEWIVANIPSSGFLMKCRIYDEDPADHDDRLGNVHIDVDSITDDWQGFKGRKFKVKKRMGSKRAYTIRGCAAMFSRDMKMSGDVIVSVENMGRSPGREGGRAYTIGPLAWSRHFSPLIGRLTGTKDTSSVDKDGKSIEKYNFQAIQIQLSGPVPADLYHRYVEFKPFVAGMFTDHSLRGRILNRALHHQHARIYNYDRSTKYGSYAEPCTEMTQNFLDLVHYDQGGRIFTYVLTLDGLWRFTETGKEFGIDLLSKHTMHSDVSIYIAFSGEFFIRRIKHPKSQKHGHPPDPSTETYPSAPDPDAVKEDDTNGERPMSPSKDPSKYELIIDNDSGTYRPNAKLLHVLRDYMMANLVGMKVSTLDSQSDAEKMGKLKDEQRERKKASGMKVTYMQNKSGSSISSSEEEELGERANGGGEEGKWKGQMHKAMGGGEDHHHESRAPNGGELVDGQMAREGREDGTGGGENEKVGMTNGSA